MIISNRKVQEEWHTQRRKNPNQQVRFHTDRAVRHLPQTAIVSSPTKNTYIDLEVQEFTSVAEGVEDHVNQVPKQSTQQSIPLIRASQSQAYTAGISENREQRIIQQKQDIQVTRNEQSVYQKERLNRPGIDSMLPLPTPLHTDNDVVGVAVGGEVGCFQVDTSFNHDRLSKGKGKVDEQGLLIDKVPLDKINPYKTKFVNIDDDPNSEPNIDEYRPPVSEDEYDDDTQSLEAGIEAGEETSTSYHN